MKISSIFSLFFLVFSPFLHSVNEESGFSGGSKYRENIAQIVDMVLQDGYSHGLSRLTDIERVQVLEKIINDREIESFFVDFMSKKMQLEQSYNTLTVMAEKADYIKDVSILSFVASAALLNLYFGGLIETGKAKLSFKNILLCSSSLSGLSTVIAYFLGYKYQEEKTNFVENNDFALMKENESAINNLLINRIVNAIHQVVDSRA